MLSQNQPAPQQPLQPQVAHAVLVNPPLLMAQNPPIIPLAAPNLPAAPLNMPANSDCSMDALAVQDMDEVQVDYFQGLFDKYSY